MAKIKVTVDKINGYCNLPMQVGDCFFVEDSKSFIPEGKYICIWALQSMMPIFPILAERDKLDKGELGERSESFFLPRSKRVGTISS